MVVNNITLMGRIGKIERRTTEGRDGIERVVLTFSLVTDEGYWDKGKDAYIERPVWHRCAVFGTYAESLSESGRLTVGYKYALRGRLAYNKHKDEKTGSMYDNSFIVIEELKFIAKSSSQKPVESVEHDEIEMRNMSDVTDGEIPF